MDYNKRFELSNDPIRQRLERDRKRGENTVSEDELEERLALKNVKWRYWAIIRRCHDPNSQSFMDYGAKGVYVADEWRKKKEGLRNFRRWLVMEGMTNENRANWTVGRVTPSSPYGPDTCTLETMLEQQRNKSTTRWIEDADTGARISVVEYCELTGENYNTVKKNVRAGKGVSHPSFMKLKPSEKYDIVCFVDDKLVRRFGTPPSVTSWVTSGRRAISEVLNGTCTEALGMKWRYVKNGDMSTYYKLSDGKYVEAPL